MESQTLLQAITATVAIIGAVTGTAALALGVANFLRDRSKVRVTVRAGRRVINSDEYDPAKTYVIVTVSNAGRRAVYITDVSLWTPRGPWAQLHDGLRNPDTFPEGGSPRTYLVEQDLIEGIVDRWAGIRAVVEDAAGKRYVSSPIAERPAAGDDLGRLERLRMRLLWHCRSWVKMRTVADATGPQ